MYDIIDGKAKLEIGEEVYELVDSSIYCIKPIGNLYFKNVRDESELVLTREQLRRDNALHARY